MTKTDKSLSELINIISTLRAPAGCPWDRKQTPRSLKKYILEETHELLEAIDDDDPVHICEELGDLLFQILFISELYSEKKLFTLKDAIKSISKKMVRRHPHVFGEEEITTEKELRKKWDAIKAHENAAKNTPKGLLDSIPKSLPALRRAQRVGERAARRGFEWPEQQAAINKLQEEFDELLEAVSKNKKDTIAEETGDMIFTLANIGRLFDFTAEEALQSTTENFIHRFSQLENIIKKQGKSISDLTDKEIVDLWQSTKMN